MPTERVPLLRSRRPLTPWELSSLLTPVHTYRGTARTRAVDRPHFPAILAFIHRNRFAVASQVQRRFANLLRSARTTRRHLKEMEILRYIATTPTRSTSPLFPKVYYVTGRGVRKLREAYATKGKELGRVTVDRRSRHTREGYTAEQVLHEILVTEFLLAVWQTIHGRPDLELLTMQRRSLKRHPAFSMKVQGRETRLEPDAMFLFRQTGNGMVCCFLEIDTGAMNLKQIRQKYRRYEAWAQSVEGQQYLIDLYHVHGAANPRPNFRILMVAGDRAEGGGHERVLSLIEVAFGVSKTLGDRLWFTTISELRRIQHASLPIEETIWQRGRDWQRESMASRIAVDVREQDAAKAGGRSSLALARDRIPLHSLFPSTQSLP